VLISKFIKYFGVDVEEELEESTSTINHIFCLKLHKMGFSKVNNFWTTKDDGGTVGNNDDKVGPSGTNQGNDDSITTKPMKLVP